jgi:hypothetical protein
MRFMHFSHHPGTPPGQGEKPMLITIGDMERAAGITDRAAFWAQFEHIRGSVMVIGHLRDARFVAVVAELHRLIATQAKPKATKRRAAK